MAMAEWLKELSVKLKKMEIVAKSTYLRISDQKLSLVARLLVGLTTGHALGVLKNLPQKGAAMLSLVLKQGIGNAVNNYHLGKDSLVIKSIEVCRGPALKRGQPISRGQMHPILKRTSHIKIIIKGEPSGTKS